MIGHQVYGATVAAVFVVLRRETSGPSLHRSLDPFLRAGVAGTITTLVLRLVPGFAPSISWTWLLVGLITGVLYPLVFSAEREHTGPALIRGTVYGFLCWIAVALSLRPLVHDKTLGWSPSATTSATGQLPGYFVLGAGIAVLFTGLGAVGRGLLVDDVRLFEVKAPRARGLRATGYGALAGSLAVWCSPR